MAQFKALFEAYGGDYEAATRRFTGGEDNPGPPHEAARGIAGPLREDLKRGDRS